MSRKLLFFQRLTRLYSTQTAENRIIIFSKPPHSKAWYYILGAQIGITFTTAAYFFTPLYQLKPLHEILQNKIKQKSGEDAEDVQYDWSKTINTWKMCTLVGLGAAVVSFFVKRKLALKQVDQAFLVKSKGTGDYQLEIEYFFKTRKKLIEPNEYLREYEPSIKEWGIVTKSDNIDNPNLYCFDRIHLMPSAKEIMTNLVHGRPVPKSLVAKFHEKSEKSQNEFVFGKK